jgi:ABC-type antimicrobial peptide transport system permease subunit
LSTIGEPPTPYIHYVCSQAPDPGESILARTPGDAALVLAAMRRELLTLEPNATVLENQTMTTQVSATLMPARLGAITVSVVGALAMILAAVGLYGAVAYSVGRRTREIGIRMALGASRGSVLKLIMRQGLAVAVVGIGAGAVLGLAAARIAASALYDVSFVDPIAWTVAPLVVIAVAAAANLAPAVRAARVNPSVAVRSE